MKLFLRQPLAAQVEQFCKRHSLPYSRTFVCIFVYSESDDHNAPGGHLGYGLPYLLKNDIVIPDIEIVCTKDIQNAVANARNHEDNAAAMKRYMKNFTDLRAMDLNKKTAALIDALERREETYAEARILRRLRDEDVQRRLF